VATPSPPPAPGDSPRLDPDVERLLAPVVRQLPQPTSLSPLPYDLNAGVPDPDSLPWRELSEAAARALERDPAGALTYGGQQGYEPLRAWIAEQQSRETGLDLTVDHITLTSGSAHGINNIAATFLAPGDTVVVAAPSYPGAIRTFQARGALLVDVPEDRDGMDPDALRVALESLRAAEAPAKLIYVMSSYANPSGTTLPVERRERIVQLATEHGALLIEDDAYTGIDLDGPPPRSLFAIAGGRGVLRAGTFSKTIATGLRVGWLTGTPELIAPLVFMRFDNGASPLLHRTVLEYLEAGHHDPHIAELRDLYRERRDAAAAALDERCGDYVSFDRPAGGFFHWLRLKESLDAASVVRAAAARGVAVTGGPGYYANGGGDDRVRVVYSALPPDRLRDAISLLGEAFAAEAERGA
jgi:2-aminoadipate transaminase